MEGGTPIGIGAGGNGMINGLIGPVGLLTVGRFLSAPRDTYLQWHAWPDPAGNGL